MSVAEARESLENGGKEYTDEEMERVVEIFEGICTIDYYDRDKGNFVGFF